VRSNVRARSMRAVVVEQRAFLSVPGKTDILNLLTASSEMSCLTGKSLRHLKKPVQSLDGVKFKRYDMGVRRTQVAGKKGYRKIEYVVDCVAGTHSRLRAACTTQAPRSIVTQIQFKGIIKGPRVCALEQVINPSYFFAELVKREMRIQVATKEDIA